MSDSPQTPVPPAPPETPEAKLYAFIRELLERQFAVQQGLLSFPEVQAGERPLLVRADRLHDVMAFLRAHPDLEFDALMCQGGYDDGAQMSVIYNLFSYRHRHRFLVKCPLDRDKPRVSTVCDLWPVANFFEREAWDGYGIVFEGHPDLRRIMNPDDWVGHPMRKDYVYPTEYHGIPTWREDQFFGVGK